MPSETETQAFRLVCALYDIADGKPQEWRMLEELDGMTAEGIVFAAARGWVDVQAGQSISLTIAGRHLLDRLAG
jgi:hypothetical protein